MNPDCAAGGEELSARLKAGLFESANGGTVFLDEVDDLPLGIQSRLLRFLEERTVRRVGSTNEIALDVRVIAASKVDLRDAVRHRRFREDLFYRLVEFPVRVPPLQERNGDIRLLATHFLKTNTAGRAISESAFGLLEQHDWPGNIRELKNVIARAASLAQDGLVGLSQVAAALEAVKLSPADSGAAPGDAAVAGVMAGKKLVEILAETERDTIWQTLMDCRFNRAEAARRLDMSYKGLLYALVRLGLGERLNRHPHQSAPGAASSESDKALIRAMESTGNVRKAADALGRKKETVYERLRELGLSERYLRRFPRRRLPPLEPS